MQPHENGIPWFIKLFLVRVNTVFYHSVLLGGRRGGGKMSHMISWLCNTGDGHYNLTRKLCHTRFKWFSNFIFSGPRQQLIEYDLILKNIFPGEGFGKHIFTWRRALEFFSRFPSPPQIINGHPLISPVMPIHPCLYSLLLKAAPLFCLS